MKKALKKALYKTAEQLSYPYEPSARDYVALASAVVILLALLLIGMLT